MPPILMWVLVVVAAAVCGALGYYFGGENRKRTAEAKIGSAEEEAKRIVNDAIKAAEQKRKETIIEAKDEAFKLKADADKEIKDRRAEISRQERRMDELQTAFSGTHVCDVAEEADSQNRIRDHLNPGARSTAYVSIMQGCEMKCAYCIVPYTRGAERSRPIRDVVDEVKMLADSGVKEVTLLGQIVNRYGRQMDSVDGKGGFVQLLDKLLAAADASTHAHGRRHPIKRQEAVKTDTRRRCAHGSHSVLLTLTNGTINSSTEGPPCTTTGSPAVTKAAACPAYNGMKPAGSPGTSSTTVAGQLWTVSARTASPR